MIPWFTNQVSDIECWRSILERQTLRSSIICKLIIAFCFIFTFYTASQLYQNWVCTCVTLRLQYILLYTVTNPFSHTVCICFSCEKCCNVKWARAESAAYDALLELWEKSCLQKEGLDPWVIMSTVRTCQSFHSMSNGHSLFDNSTRYTMHSLIHQNFYRRLWQTSMCCSLKFRQ